MDIKEEIKQIKSKMLDIGYNKCHMSSSLGAFEILYALYTTININKSNVSDLLNRDMVVLSKEHCRLAQVCILAHLGLLEEKLLDEYLTENGKLGHDIFNFVMKDEKYSAIDYGSGSLGHGEGVAAGLALANPDRNIYCLIGDGELQEGSLWEAFMFVIQHKLTNLTTIIDRNYLQIDNYTKNIIDTSSNLEEKMKAFGFEVIVVDGHNIEKIKEAINLKTQNPKCIIADTIKGRGMEFLKDELGCAMYHHSYLTEEMRDRIYEAISNEQ